MGYHEENLKELEVKVGDVLYFQESFNKKRNEYSFVGKKNHWGKFVISKENFHRSGFFEIKSILKDKNNFALVELGERVCPEDLYPEISLDEAKKVLTKFGFEIFEKVISFTDDGEKRTETQLLAWNKEKGLWINGTTWYGEKFNNLELTIPNVLHTFDVYCSGQYMTSSEEVTINICNSSYSEQVLTKICRIINTHRDSEHAAKISLQINHTKSKKISHTGLSSYLSQYVKDDSYDCWQEYQEELFEELPESAKRFFAHHQLNIDN